jgi:hypothetical protein
MDILTLELFDVTISEALREVDRALATQPALPLRILLGPDPMLRHNVQRLLDRLGRPATQFQEGQVWRVDVAGTARGPAAPPKAPPPAPAGAPAPMPAAPAGPGVRPLLITRSHLGQGSQDIGRRLLLGVLRELDPAVPWLGLALEGLDLLDDPQARTLLDQLQARGTPVRISRESQLFPLDPGLGFEVMEDSRWQRLAGRGEMTII